MGPLLPLRSHFLIAASCCCAIAALDAQAQFQKCTEANGKVTYQDGPCAPGTGRKSDAARTSPEQVSAAHRRAMSKRWDEYMRQQREELAKKPIPKEALNQGPSGFGAPKKRPEPRIGMSADEVIDARGKPDSINRTTTADGVYEQWVYRSGKYIYLDNGKVRAIQDSQ